MCTHGGLAKEMFRAITTVFKVVSNPIISHMDSVYFLCQDLPLHAQGS